MHLQFFAAILLALPGTALAETPIPNLPNQSDASGSGPVIREIRLTSSEMDALRVAIERCWNVGSLSTEAQRVAVEIGMIIGADGRPVASSIELLSFSGGSDSAVRQAYEAARRAILRCGSQGLPVPARADQEGSHITFGFHAAEAEFDQAAPAAGKADPRAVAACQKEATGFMEVAACLPHAHVAVLTLDAFSRIYPPEAFELKETCLRINKTLAGGATCVTAAISTAVTLQSHLPDGTDLDDPLFSSISSPQDESKLNAEISDARRDFPDQPLWGLIRYSPFKR
ncbi:hypothetical protein IQ03_04549 [Gemmobacter caeni]|uniref:TonB family protein n=1 Tax=Gemmobacter caeni TaxID=589035 RepID=A0A2T6AP95_9RHOB|nr:hypothetical protein [Gemmobacter caeni]PTX45641.1 hypothetical protein C8N34_12171 [Gemmobacter caeni]TWI93788.1 hypothetical protein IQ03_04549 [Gemmobacter caeni]